MGRAALALVDPADQGALDITTLELDGFERVIIRTIDYDRLDREAEAIASEASELGIDFVLFSRNDQVFSRPSVGPLIRMLRTGYSSFSGIDDEMAHVQARLALADLRRGEGRLEAPVPAKVSIIPKPESKGTFTLVFDTEQIGGARFGVPRILELLDQYNVRATFFVTGFIQQIYPELLPALVDRGHEIGLHGSYHESLAGMPLDDQTNRLREHLAEFRRHYPVVGANFIYRMDANTVRALVKAGLSYFVVFAYHYYRPFAYRRPPARPLPVCTADGGIWLVPVPVETYALPGFAARMLAKSVLIRSREQGTVHVTVLMHPFRDGSLRHLHHLDAMLNYLVNQEKLRPVPLEESIPTSRPAYGSMEIVASVERIDASYSHESRCNTWTRSESYFERVSTLHHALSELGHYPTLALDLNGRAEDAWAIYPEVPAGEFEPIQFDPLASGRMKGKAWEQLLQLLDGRRGRHAFFPPGRASQLALMLDSSRPRHWQDLYGLVPESAIRLAYRIRKNRMLF